MRSENSRGRRYPEPAHPYRSEYARDRDRIIHSRAFRRLEAKTQVFTSRFSDHFRNRLTHTLEVSQIGRTVAQALSLNTELVEALALVHDIGHPPFGHAGERKLDELMAARGSRFEVFLDGKSLYSATDTTIPSAGRVALWTKADSITHFDDLRIQTL